MAAETFETSLTLTLVHEGGYVNHPDDPGGATNRGVIQSTYNAYRRRMGLPVRSVKLITDDEVKAIYRDQYWRLVAGDQLPAGVDYAVFDYGVNSGPRRAVKDLQRVVGADPDGLIGNNTLDAVGQMEPAEIIRQLCKRRFAFVKRLRHWKSFGRGWTRRIMGEQLGIQSDDIGVIDRAILMARNAAPGAQQITVPLPKAAAPVKALEDDAKTTAVLKEAAKDPKWLGILGAFGSTIATVATSSGPVAWAVAAVLVGGGIYLLYRFERDRVTA